MPVNAVSESFTQLLTFSSIIQERVVEGGSVVTGFIKPSCIFQPCPPLDIDIKRRERNTREERAETAVSPCRIRPQERRG